MILHAALAARAALVCCCLWSCTGSISDGVLATCTPLQRHVYAALMPDFEVEAFSIRVGQGNRELHAEAKSKTYIVAGGRAYPPGVEFAAGTPARSALLYGAIIVIGMAALAKPRLIFLWVAGSVAATTSFTMAVGAPAVVLAGAQWGLAIDAFSEPSRQALLVGASRFLIHGGGYALCVAALWLSVAAGNFALRLRP